MKRPAAIAFWLLALLGVFLSAATGAASGAGAPGVGLTAPVFTLATAGGRMVSLAGLRGKPVLINFWATWCPDCRLEMPEIARFQQIEAGRVTVLGVDEREPAAIVQDFVRRGGFGWTFLLDGQGVVGMAYDVQALPTSVFVDASGVIRQKYVGPMTLGQMKAFLREAQAGG